MRFYMARTWRRRRPAGGRLAGREGARGGGSNSGREWHWLAAFGLRTGFLAVARYLIWCFWYQNMLFVRLLGQLALNSYHQHHNIRTLATVTCFAAKLNTNINSSNKLFLTTSSKITTTQQQQSTSDFTDTTTTITNREPQHHLATPIIKIHDSCIDRLKQILDKPDEQLLRIHVETGGCSGFSYMFDIESKQAIDIEEDLVVNKDNYQIVINKQILPYIKGSEICYEQSLIKSSFSVKNPLAETKCSCGVSFSVDFNKITP